MILKKYYYCIDLVDNNKQSLVKEDKVKIRDYTEITLKSVITEIVDTIITYWKIGCRNKSTKDVLWDGSILINPNNKSINDV